MALSQTLTVRSVQICKLLLDLPPHSCVLLLKRPVGLVNAAIFLDRVAHHPTHHFAGVMAHTRNLRYKIQSFLLLWIMVFWRFEEQISRDFQ